ncbi:MAG TPA: carbon starvation CstA family protein [bacterium]|uniref:Carbon starvation protein A n=1 Tax=candidate division TA06 bacterium ADurb.Bin417 TaxID=1852828 RepID=A0A1V5MEV4_UNCT6|nr:MAG: Carbon starvation protein A [candidate division TA06 bacterium ADurb.Bin417]HNQ35541.1 carbon starvation CstA family protein [bacterium]HNS48363.1 carbon starvation CstA family protein [bacterium]
MNLWLVILLTALLFHLAHRLYSRGLARVLGEEPERPTPAVTRNDGYDYVPSKTLVVFAHHFASIAGAGPIIGPTLALLYGFVPVYLWIIIGGIFIGAAHDFSAVFISLRNQGRSIAEIARGQLGNTGYFLFVLFAIMVLTLVNAAFLNLSVTALTSQAPLAAFGLGPGQHLLRVIQDSGGQIYGFIGGIASTSVIFITLLAPLVGWLLYRRGLNPVAGSFLALAICLAAVAFGLAYPVSVPPAWWRVILTIYVFAAAGIPVWLLLQPRDFTNVQILYLGIGLMLMGILAAGFQGAPMAVPAFNVQAAQAKPALGQLWPFLFITVACGAISGFHALVAGGTTAKQLSREGAARTVGFDAMLLESIMAVAVIITLSCGLDFSHYQAVVFPAPESGLQSNPILAFALALGGLLNRGFGMPTAVGTIFGILMLEGFIITTLDTSIRLQRYLFEEVWGIIFQKPAGWLKSYYFNAGLAALVMFLLARGNAYTIIWPVFGAANQLLAALTLITVSVWLTRRGRGRALFLVPAIFMLVTTIAALWLTLVRKFLPGRNYPLIAAALFLMLLAVCVAGLAAGRLIRKEPADSRT